MGGGDEALQVKGNHGELHAEKDIITQGNERRREVMLRICIKGVTGENQETVKENNGTRGRAPQTDKPRDISTKIRKLENHYDKSSERC